MAAEIARVRDAHGNQAIYAGSYGWASAGRFHHAQSQIHRFLNTIGGYTRSVQNYSYAAGDVILPHVIGTTRSLTNGQSTWDELAGHTRHIVMFGGMPHKNAQINAGGMAGHSLRGHLQRCRAAGIRFTLISPIRDDIVDEVDATWLPLRPGSDVALMLGIAHVLIAEDRHDRTFLDRCTVGFDRFSAYVLGASDGVPKTPAWAAALTEVDAGTIAALARDMAEGPTFVAMAWALQRAHHGEQPFWMAIALASLIGGIGSPGGGFGFGYGAVDGIGSPDLPFAWPSVPQGRNPVETFIPVARIADMLLEPGGAYPYNGRMLRYPDIRLVYWAGGNPFHHHQDINKLVDAWRRPRTVVVHEIYWTATARHADIVLPITTSSERRDIACSSRDNSLMPSHRIHAPFAEARDDFAVLAGLAARLGVADAFTGGLDEEAWLRRLYGEVQARTAPFGVGLPAFEDFWAGGPRRIETGRTPAVPFSAFRANPAGAPLRTPSGRIELYSETIAGFDLPDCPPHPCWLEPYEWLGSAQAARHPLHMISNQPWTKLHSQYDHGAVSLGSKIEGREPIRMNPADAAARGLSNGDIVRVFNDRGACLAGIAVSDAVRPGVVQLATGAWYDPLVPSGGGSLDKHGNPNVLTRDVGTSSLAQGPSAQTCLVEIERFRGDVPPITCFDSPVQCSD